MNLHSSTIGQGPAVILLHGWGLHAAVWDGIVPTLCKRYRVTCVDLPGHGRSDLSVDLADLDAMCAMLHTLVRPPVVLIGWSLGGLIALAYTLRHPQAVERLLLIAASPCFIRADDWKYAIQAEVLEAFGRSLELDYQTTLDRFLLLQVSTSDKKQVSLRELRRVLYRRPPQKSALRAGLKLLRETDLRHRLSEIRCPTRIILGERDTLIGKNSGRDMLSKLRNGRCVIISGAGHAPFLSHPDEFNHALQSCLDD